MLIRNLDFEQNGIIFNSQNLRQSNKIPMKSNAVRCSNVMQYNVETVHRIITKNATFLTGCPAKKCSFEDVSCFPIKASSSISKSLWNYDVHVRQTNLSTIYKLWVNLDPYQYDNTTSLKLLLLESQVYHPHTLMKHYIIR